MFTGIVEEVGTLVVREDQSDAAVLQIRADRVLQRLRQQLCDLDGLHRVG